MTVAVAVRPRHGDEYCGDAVRIWTTDPMTVLCIVDGLGHGQDAQTAAEACLAYVEQNLQKPLDTLFAECERAIRSTRGVAMGLARVDTMKNTVEYAAIGNTRGVLVQANVSSYLMSSPGIVGGGYRRLVSETRPLPHGGRLFLYTDGLPRRLDHPDFQRQLTRMPPQLLANSLIATLGEENDDSALLIYQHSSSVLT